MFYYKALAEERFHWPGAHEEVLAVSGEQINWLLEGYDIARMKGHKKLAYGALY